MDNTIITYLIKVSVALALFYGLYIFLLKKDTFLKLRRFYFLFIILFSVIFPLFTIEIPIKEEPAQIPTYWLSDIELGEVYADNSVESLLNVWTIALSILTIVSCSFAFRFLIQLLSVLKLKLNSESEKLSEFHIVKMKDVKASPFSFFHWIFVNSEIKNQAELDEIIVHESVHARQYHSVDVMLYETLCICLWWNPFVWLLKKEMKINLEYLADKGVLDDGFESKKYQYLLLQVSNKNTGIPFINNFNVSQLKKRITMMNKKKSSIFASIKYLLAVPVAMSLILGNAVQASPDLISTITENEFIIGEGVDDGQQVPQKKDGVYTVVEKMPSYPGGESAMHTFINQNLKYPIEAQKAGIQGRVSVRYVIKSSGEISDVTVIRGLDPALDKEAVRVVEAMPNWSPGKQNNIAVPVYFTLPIVFRLDKDNTASSALKKEDDTNTLFVYNGKIVSAAEFSKYEESMKKMDGVVSIMILSEANGLKKYGEKAKGKKVIEMKTPS